MHTHAQVDKIYVIRIYVYLHTGIANEIMLMIIIIIIVIHFLNSFSVPDIMLRTLLAFSSLVLPIILLMKHNFIIIASLPLGMTLPETFP